MSNQEIKEHLDKVHEGMDILYHQRHEYYYSRVSNPGHQQYNEESAKKLDAMELSLRRLQDYFPGDAKATA